ncbi:MAG: competence/damage-inducible protein A [Betaproteobacteria bacterium AqS2]|uniref:Competence/damage-inducible protein A n=1 Tax=Candidatus Amphirhobacter heronislandensis TaxID=1732024 RepID=A0A930UFH6_9GAMM|nr:competence/damage-inducible protein A [Betaproteobacteria bacterium AqS2]
MAERPPRAAFLIIGNEILSGRTRDRNLAVLAEALRGRGIRVAEARVVRDERDEVVAGLDALRARYELVFTSGGIGPTHDDITTACVAAAFGVPVVRHPEAERRMREHYEASGREATASRLTMADVPEGAELVFCAGTPAPGYRIGNVYVFAGVPRIFAGMVATALDSLPQGPRLRSRTITVHVGESEVAADLAAVQDRHPGLELGSYPQERDGSYFSELVCSGADEAAVAAAVADLTGTLDQRAIPWSAKD